MLLLLGAVLLAGALGALWPSGSLPVPRTAPYPSVATGHPAPLALLALAVVVLTGFVGRLRGLAALGSLLVAGLLLAGFVFPAILLGQPVLTVGTVGAGVIAYVLVLAHGVSARTGSALVGTLGALVLALLSAETVARAMQLPGNRAGEWASPAGAAPALPYGRVFVVAVVVTGIGLMVDVALHQASVVGSRRTAEPAASREDLYRGSLRDGREHVASALQMITMAYAGMGMTAVMLETLQGRGLGVALRSDDVIGMLIGCGASVVGLLLCVPLTTSVAAFTVAPTYRGRRRR